MALVKAVCRVMERIAPLRLAESWDNISEDLMILPFEEAPPLQRAKQGKERVLLTIDLTPPVLHEAVSKNSSIIIAYHPPIFRPLASITLANPLQASLLKCAQAGISVYSPHTALDATRGGVNDWLAACLYRVGPIGEVKCVQENVQETNAAKESGNSKTVSFSNGTIGAGRTVKFVDDAKIRDIIGEVKRQLQLQQVQVALPEGKTLDSAITSVALCAGSGGSLLSSVDAELYITGEMSHHEVLAAVAKGQIIVLCGHTNTERGYLAHLKTRLLDEFAQEEELSGVDIDISQADTHPLIFA